MRELSLGEVSDPQLIILLLKMSKCELSLEVFQIASMSQILINMKKTYRKSWAANLFMWSDLTLGPSCLVLVLEVCNVKTTYRKSWAANLLIWSDFTLGPLLQGQIRVAKLKSAFSLLINEKCCLPSKTMLVGLCRWIHPASGHRFVLGLV